MQTPPPDVQASWPPPNFDDPQSRGSLLVVVNIVLLVFTFSLTLLRLYSRICVTRWVGVDDFLIVGATALTSGTAAFMTIGCSEYGWGRHTWDIPFSMLKGHLKTFYITQILISLASFFTLTSLLVYYSRLVSLYEKTSFRLILHAVHIINFGACLAFLILSIFPCNPVQAFWSPTPLLNAKCLNPGVLVLVGGMVKSMIELIITTLPIPIMFGMKLSRLAKIGIVILLILGYGATAAGAVRAYFAWMTFYTDEGVRDIAWFQFNGLIAASFELQVGLICACIPPIQPLFKQLLGKATMMRIPSIMIPSKPSTRPPTTDLTRNIPNSNGNADGDHHDRYTFFLAKDPEIMVRHSINIELDACEQSVQDESEIHFYPHPAVVPPINVATPPVAPAHALTSNGYDNNRRYGGIYVKGK